MTRCGRLHGSHLQMHDGHVGKGRGDDLRRRHQLGRQDVRHVERRKQVEVLSGALVAQVQAREDLRRGLRESCQWIVSHALV